MRKYFVVFGAVLIFMQVKAHAVGAAEAGVGMLIEQTQLEVLAQNIQQYYTMYQSLMNAYDQFEKIKRMAEYEADNFKKLDPAHMNLRDWQSFVNEQMDNERRIERTFQNISIDVDGQQVTLEEMEKMQYDALDDKFAEMVRVKTKEDITDKDRRRLWESFGLTSANYDYMKVWQSRERAAGHKIEAWFGGEDSNGNPTGELAKRQQEAAKKRSDAEQAASDAKGANEIAGAALVADEATDMNLQIIQEEVAAIGAIQDSVFKQEEDRFNPILHDYGPRKDFLRESNQNYSFNMDKWQDGAMYFGEQKRK